MSALVLGTVQFGMDYGINNKTGRPSIDQVREILSRAYELGIKELDTAQSYGDAEKVLNEISPITNKFLIHSKFSLKENKEIGNIEELLKLSLRNIGAKKLGYFFFHRFSDFKEFLISKNYSSPVIDLNSLGLAVSVYSEAELEMAQQYSFVRAIQIPFNIFDSSTEKLRLVKEAKRKGIKIYSRSVFLQGLFFKQVQDLPEKLKGFRPYLEQLGHISKIHGIDKAALALNFVKQVKDIDGVVIGVDNIGQLESNIKLWNLNCPDIVLKKVSELTFPDKDLLMPKNW